MTRNQATIWTFAAGMAILLLAVTHRPHTDAQPLAKALKGMNPEKRELLGSASCAASVCHGGGQFGARRSEATTFFALDPHARAFDTLTTKASQDMAALYFRDKTQAHEATLCLKCHVHPEYDPEHKHARPSFRREDGVGCESCHGVAQDWLTPHYRRETWKEKMKMEDKIKLGFADTKDLAGRANVCVTCHVGTAHANVDHDLIAAGHPPLRFEFATYLANLPPHWDVKKDQETPDFEIRAWAIGQFTASASAFELLAHRAEKGAIWPEFAELDCFSCHHQLAGNGWRQPRRLPPRRPDPPAPWSEWYMTMTPAMFVPKKGAFNFRERPTDRVELADRARKAAQRLHFEAGHDQGGIDHVKFLKAAVQRIARGGTPDNWDAAAQHYLSFMALRQTLSDAQAKEINLDSVIASLRGEVTFRPPVNGPPPRFVGPTPKVETK